MCFKYLTLEIRFGYGQFITDTLTFFTNSDVWGAECKCSATVFSHHILLTFRSLFLKFRMFNVVYM